jgi:uncharacterized membrane protein
MLIAPFAGPAMNAALASARGDRALLLRSILRYFIGLAVSVLPAAALTALMGQEVATAQTVQVSQVSTAALLLPLAAGAAGALNLCQSERSNLVSGAATGMLVAASLAPPTAVIGMAAVLGDWQIAKGALFVVLLQILGINLSGAFVLFLFGVRPRGARYERGSKPTIVVSLACTCAALVALMTLQFRGHPELQRSTRAREAAAVVKQAIETSRIAKPVEVNMRFTRADIPSQETLLGVIYVERTAQRGSDSEIARELTKRIQRHLHQHDFQVTPLVNVTVLAPPGTAPVR